MPYIGSKGPHLGLSSVKLGRRTEGAAQSVFYECSWDTLHQYEMLARYDEKFMRRGPGGLSRHKWETRLHQGSRRLVEENIKTVLMYSIGAIPGGLSLFQRRRHEVSHFAKWTRSRAASVVIYRRKVNYGRDFLGLRRRKPQNL